MNIRHIKRRKPVIKTVAFKTQKQFVTFRNYLMENNHTDKCISVHLQNIRYFTLWAKTQKIKDIAFAKIGDVTQYIQYLQNQEITVGTINGRLNTLRKYFSMQIENGIIAKHPIRRLNIRGRQEKVVQNVLSEQELTDLYLNYSAFSDAKTETIVIGNRRPLKMRKQINERCKLIVGLMIFQGLHTGELENLKVEHLNLNNGTIYIPSSARGNSRVLELSPMQLISFYQYVNHLPTEQEKLFSIVVQQKMAFIIEELKGINPKVINAQHIRSCVLMTWIKKHKKRKAQYMIGHKHVSTTEKYELQDTQELSEVLKKAHLFG